MEGSRENLTESSEKYQLELFKLPKTLKDLIDDMKGRSQIGDEDAAELQVFGVLQFATQVQFARLWQLGRNTCVFYLEPKIYTIEPEFSVKGLQTFLDLLVKVYRCKVSAECI